MWKWLKRRPSDRDNPLRIAERETHRAPATSGEYVALHEYLDRRFAVMVVLTVTEIEDLLGFTLPDAARVDLEWWADPKQDTARPSYQDAWRLAGRTATPNLAAQTVAFERLG